MFVIDGASELLARYAKSLSRRDEFYPSLLDTAKVFAFLEVTAVQLKAASEAGSAGIPARLSAQRENCETYTLQVEVKRKTWSVLAARLRAGIPALPAS